MRTTVEWNMTGRGREGRWRQGDEESPRNSTDDSSVSAESRPPRMRTPALDGPGNNVKLDYATMQTSMHFF